MKKFNGFISIGAIIAIVAVLVIGGGVAYVVTQNNKQEDSRIMDGVIADNFGFGNTVIETSKKEVNKNIPNEKSQEKAQTQNIQNKDISINNKTEAEENFKKTPGAIKSIKKNGSEYNLGIDILTRNENWRPGDDASGSFFVNQNPLIRSLIVTNSTKTYGCSDSQNSATPDNTINYITKITESLSRPETLGEFGYTAYFDIEGTKITAIYTQCLP